MRSVLASRHVELEVIVLDDASTDRTAEIVRALAAEDPRVRLEPAPPLPDGWCGKQHACFALSKLARFDTLTFLDADVRLEPDALARMALFLQRSGADLVSGFPRQETGTLLEKLLIPLINWLLLCFLPLWGMRRFRWSAFGAGCGQWFMTTPRRLREGRRARGDSRVAARRADAAARVPQSGSADRRVRRDVTSRPVGCTARRPQCGSGWRRTPAREWPGPGRSRSGPWCYSAGRWLPYLLVRLRSATRKCDGCALYALLIAITVRRWTAAEFHQSLLGEVLHPVAILLLLAVQWYAIVRAVSGKPVGWKGRVPPTK